jgi:uncharacterized linocin/CFP29 family protein
MASSEAQPIVSIEPADQSIHDEENKKVPWSEEIWKAIQRVVHEETTRVRVGATFLPQRRVSPKTTSVPADLIRNQPISGETSNTLTIDEGVNIRLNEIWTEFALTTQQIHETAEAKNPEHTSAVTLARRAAQYLALAQDIVIFHGANGFSAPFFQQNVRSPPGQVPIDGGLLSLPQPASPPWVGSGPFASSNAAITVGPLSGTPGVLYGENTFAAVATGCSVLTSQGQRGPYALILHTVPYADLFAPFGNGSLVVTADRVIPLVKAGLFDTGTLPPNSAVPPTVPPPKPTPPYFGVLVSIGGQTIDLVIGLQAKTVFMQQDTNQNWRFRVLERFALRVTDPSAIVTLVFTA